MKQSGIIEKFTRTISSKSQIDLEKLIEQNFLEKIRHKCLIGS